jgi:replicative DNA helicase
MNSEVLDRLPPQDLDAERGVLGSVMLQQSLLDDVVLIVRAEDFYSEAHQRLFTHLAAMHDEGGRIDAVLLADRLKKAGALEAVGGPTYIAEVMQSVAVAPHAAYYAKIVRDKAVLRNLIAASTDTLRRAYDPTEDPRELLSAAERAVLAVRDERADGHVAGIQDVLVRAMAQIDRRAEQGGAAGLPTGFTELDRMTGGLHDSELIILAARPSMGKTAMATDMAAHAAIDSEVPTLFASLEMSETELANRLLSAQARVDGYRIRNGMLSVEDREALGDAAGVMARKPLFIDDTPSRTVTEIAAVARRMQRQQGLGLVVVDYLQLIEPADAREARHQQVAVMTRRLKGLARELEIPVLCVAQLNRQADGSTRPKLTHLRESGAIEQDADVVMFVHRDEYYADDAEQQADQKGKAEVLLRKQRNGPTGDVKLTWREEYTTFEDRAPNRYSEFDGYDHAGGES